MSKEEIIEILIKASEDIKALASEIKDRQSQNEYEQERSCNVYRNQ